MSLFSRLAGTVATFFQIGGPGGPGLEDNAGVLEARAPGPGALVNVRGADAVAAHDFVTLEQVPAGLVETAATVVSGQVYPMKATDTQIRFDTTGGATATADMIAPTLIGQRATFYWWAWGAGQVAPTINVDAGHKMVPFSGQATSGAAGLVTTTTITTTGAAFTLEWNGTEWVSV